MTIHRTAPSAALAAACLLALSSASAAERTAPSFEEVMAQGRSIEEARFSPDGAKLLFAVSDHARPTRGILLGPGVDLKVADLKTGAVRTITGANDPDTYFEACASWSPDGKGVTFLRRHGPQPVAAYYELETGRTTEFAAPVETFCNNWVGGRLAYVTRTGEQASSWSFTGALDNLARRWRAAWETDAPQVSVHSSNPDYPAAAADHGGLVLADPRTGAATVVAHGDFNLQILASPDARRFAVVRMAEQIAAPLDRMAGRRGEAQVYELTPSGARLLAALPGFDAGRGALAWSPDGRRLLVGGRAPGAAAASLLVLDPETGRREPLAAPRGASLLSDDTFSALSIFQIGWVGGRPAALAQTAEAAAPSADARMQYGPERPRAVRLFSFGPDGTANDLTGFAQQSVRYFADGPAGDALLVANGALWRVGPAHAPRRITDRGLQVLGIAEARSSYGDRVVPAIGGGRIALRVRSGGEDRFTVVDLARGAPGLSIPATTSASFAPDLSTAAHLAPQGWTGRLVTEGALARVVAEANPEWRDRPAGRVERFTYRVGERDLNGWVVLPPGYVSGPLPGLVWIYGGTLLRAAPPEAALPGGGPTPFYNGQLWAREGYAYLFISAPIGKGADSDIPKELAASAVSAVDAAAAKGWVDPGRVGIMGQSFGGYSTASVLSKRSDRFRAGVAISGVYDYAAGWGSRFPPSVMLDEGAQPFVVETRGYVEEGQAGLLAPPWKDPEAYRRNSPFYQAQDIRSPLMLFVGDFDLGVTDLSLAERFYAALRRTGNPAVLVRYWGEGHVQKDPWAIKDEWTRARAWFGKYLAATPAETRP